MEDFKQASNLDSGLIDEIVCKVKSEGLFDQFRRECLADVDTKPAYQNLQHRVESSVSLFLDEQKWDSQTNKNQLREKLRKLIAEKSFFEAGIGRIVDQVVNPKLNTNFVPKIEDVAYKLLGIEKPSMNMNLKLEIETDALLPIYELEQVSPDSDKSLSIPVRYQTPEECDGKNEDLESPAFEPIEPSFLESNDDMDISDDDATNDKSNNDDDDDVDNGQSNGFTSANIDEVKSNLSSISGLTSNDSNNSSYSNLRERSENNVIDTKDDNGNPSRKITDENRMAPEITIDSAEKLPLSENIISNTSDLNTSQDSVLSQVSSTSRLSIVTYNTRTGDGETDSVLETYHESSQNICPYGISEEAQMQKFNENSSSSNSLVIDTDNLSIDTFNSEKKVLITSFEGKFYDDKKCIDNVGNDAKMEDLEMEQKMYSHKLDSNESVDSKCKADSHADQSRQNVPFPTSSHRKKDSNRERSSRKDDHSTHKGPTSRQRSRSKDSNDGCGSSSHNESNINEQSTTNNRTNNISSKESEHVTSQYSSSEDTYREQVIIPNSQPVVIDQILTGNELDLTSFIGENRDDPVLSSIKQTFEQKIMKPKVAANIAEAKRLTKIRKQIERCNQKKLEKATVLAKQYIRTNASNMLDDTQGIEVEFVCVENRMGRNMSGPIISSPISKKIIDPISPHTTNMTTLKQVDEINSLKKNKYDEDDDDGDVNFVGFAASEVETAGISVTHLVNACSTIMSKTSKSIDNDTVDARPSKKLRECSIKQEGSPHIDDQVSSKKRYSNDDLFKPRPLLGGISRRRRGFDN
ncbi:biorientation of chromosomes in cell division protein 1-like 1 [Sitodiplosis mosellana]|uniref:biorientation of chromosomes in cell division protein 1-like 1 n=1 Tax=Sitodiplosis mosellana TaxID=263140 RepID=UPI00244479E8|nr:biorientation of chromosomes in cell division protein 1-like 1 [Sitodiplosis mosellana]